jgi:hypothetical protein
MRFAAIPGFLRMMHATLPSLCFVVLKHHCQTELTQRATWSTIPLNFLRGIIGLLILDFLVFTLPDDQAIGTSTEFIRAPERVNRIPSKE